MGEFRYVLLLKEKKTGKNQWLQKSSLATNSS